MKCCRRCSEAKPDTAFARHSEYGHQDWCRACHRAYQAQYERSPRTTEQRRAERLKRLYGLDISVFNRLLEDQGFCCASCGDELDLGTQTHVDHCHESGRVRGVLCRPCNQALGFLKDDPARVERLLAYAQRTTERKAA